MHHQDTVSSAMIDYIGAEHSDVPGGVWGEAAVPCPLLPSSCPAAAGSVCPLSCSWTSSCRRLTIRAAGNCPGVQSLHLRGYKLTAHAGVPPVHVRTEKTCLQNVIMTRLDLKVLLEKQKESQLGTSLFEQSLRLQKGTQTLELG